MSNATTETIEKIEKELKTAFAKAPAMIRVNGIFNNLTDASFQMMEVIKSQQNQIEALKEVVYSKEDI